jgi:murein DD-endopeptidase MepM/ murein hydrolase activator NlpD
LKKIVVLKKSRFKFKYNHETLSFEPIKRSFSAILRRSISFIFSTTFIAIVACYFLFRYIKSPKEVMLENELENMEFNYNVMSDRMINLEKVLSDLQERDDNIYRVILEADPIRKTNENEIYGGIERYNRIANSQHSQLINNTIQRLNKITKDIYIQSKSFDELFQLAKEKEKMLVSIPSILPIYDDKNTLRHLVSFFGMRPHPRYKVMKRHDGVDFSFPIGTPIHVTGDGVVIDVKYMSGYGNTIIVDHGYNYKTLYGHLLNMDVRLGQVVKRGEIIGKSGNTGNSVGPHLHYEVHYKGVAVNPINFFAFDLSPKEYNEMLQRSISMGQSLD